MDTPFANDRLDAIAREVLARLEDIPEELVVDNPHQALLELAALIAERDMTARERLHEISPSAVSPSASCFQALIDELPAVTRRAFGMHLANPRLGQLAQELGMPEKAVLRHVGQAYCHLRKRLSR